MGAAFGVVRRGRAGDARGRRAGRSLRPAAGALFAATLSAASWVILTTTADEAVATDGSAAPEQRRQSRPEQSSVEETTHPARSPRQVRVPSTSSVAPSDTLSGDAVTDDAAIGMASSTDDGDVGDGVAENGGAPEHADADAAGDTLGGLPRSSTWRPGHPVRSVTGLLGLDPHDHPWDEQPPPVVDLGQVIDPEP